MAFLVYAAHGRFSNTILKCHRRRARKRGQKELESRCHRAEQYEKKAANSFFSSQQLVQHPTAQKRSERRSPLVQAENRLFWLSSIFKTSFLGLMTG